MKLCRMPTLAAAALAALLVAPPSAQAQDVTYTTVTEVEMGGPMGAMASMFGGDMGSQETTYLSGTAMRTDSDGSSTIVDVSDGRIFLLDHDSEEYSVMTLASMQAMADSMAGEAGRAMGGEDAPETEIDVSIDMEEAGETRMIDGMEARRVFMTMDVEGEMEPMGTGEDAAAMEEQSFRMVYFMDMWLTDDLPRPEGMDEAMREMAGEWQDQGGGMAAAFASNPNVQVAMERSEEELAEMAGTALESITYMVMLPQDADFDREAVLARADQPLSEGLDLGGAMAGAAGEAARNALGGLGGLFGGGDEEEEEEPEEEGMAPPENGQVIFMRMTTRLTDFEESDLPDTLFQVPEGYTEVSMPGMGG
jgi:hypothetical protein